MSITVRSSSFYKKAVILRPALLGLLLLLAFASRRPPAPPSLAPYPWLYQRAGAPVQPGEELVSLIAVGDLNLGRGVAPDDALQDVSAWLRAADLALGNLECAFLPVGTAVTPQPDSPITGYSLLASSEALRQLPAAGFDLMGLANNHALDAGAQALADTARRLTAAGITALGAPEVAYTPQYRQVNGLRLAFLAFNSIPAAPQICHCNPIASGGEGATSAGWNLARAEEAVRAARAGSAAVIVSIHWGYEYQLRPDPAQRFIAERLFAAGADLIVGHHPHVVQDYAVQPQPDGSASFVAYSLGNFVFDQGMAETGAGLALRVLFDAQGLRAIQALPLAAGPRPRLVDPAEAASLVERWQAQASLAPKPFAISPDCSKPTCQFALQNASPSLPASPPQAPGSLASPPRQLAWRCNADECRPVDPPPVEVGAIFQTGAVDLTGDGIPEQLQLVDGKLTIYQDGAAAWESPPEWQIADLAPGDPDGDGRAELALALWKPDAAGVLRSHPFLLGYRGGLYRTTWGGSAVGDPIAEVELGDIDGDGEQELLVLEEDRAGRGRAVTVWRWHGWGFLLQWRSPYGEYGDMRFVEGEVVVEAGVR